MKRRIPFLGAALLLAGAAFLPAHARADEAKPAVIRIGAGGSGLGKPQLAATLGILQDLGLLEEEFKDDGIKIEWSFFKGVGPAQNEAFANDTLDFGFQGNMSAIIGRASGLKVKAVSTSGVRVDNYIGIRADSTIASVKDFKGKKIAILVGTPPYLFLCRLLEANGLTLQDVQIVNINGENAVATLLSGQVDMVIGRGVFDTTHVPNPAALKLFYTTKDDADEWKNISVFTAREDFLKQYPDIARRVVKQWIKAAQWGSEEANRAQMLEFWSRGGLPLAGLQEEYAGRSGKSISTPLLDGYFREKMRQDVALCQRIGAIRKPFDVDEWIDSSFQDAALKELGLENYWPSSSGVENQVQK